MSNLETPPIPEPIPARKRRLNLVWVFLGALILAVAAGSLGGYFAGKALYAERQQTTIFAFDLEQFKLAGEDIKAGNYRVAAERLDSILKNEPQFPGAAELREQALAALNATPTPRPTATQVPSPTPDAPRAEQLLTEAKQEFTDQRFDEMIVTLLKLKVEIPGYQPERVDGLLWVALRYNGVHLIKDTNRLTEGMYYLDLAKNYAPLDYDAEAQNKFAADFLALYQSAYYYRNKDIEKSWKLFAQVVSIRPYYSDTLRRDYADILVQNGDALVNQNACAAWGYYEMALGQIPDYEPAIKGRDYAQQNCGGDSPVYPEGYGPALEATPG
jgi:hypothetical protein